MRCPSCNTETPIESAFCNGCGNKIVLLQQAANLPTNPFIIGEKNPSTVVEEKSPHLVPHNLTPTIVPIPQPTTKSPNKLFLSLLISLALLAVLILGIVLYFSFSANDAYKNKTPIVNTTFQVPAGKFQSYRISLPNSGRVEGQFEAQGEKEKIEVVIFDQQGMQAFQDGGHANQVYYNSHGYVRSGKIDKPLAAGIYFILFNNIDAVKTDKTVTANINAAY